jgi:hypothetical protein
VTKSLYSCGFAGCQKRQMPTSRRYGIPIFTEKKSALPPFLILALFLAGSNGIISIKFLGLPLVDKASEHYLSLATKGEH